MFCFGGTQRKLYSKNFCAKLRDRRTKYKEGHGKKRRLASLITQWCFTSTAGGSPDFLKMTGSTMAECSVSTSYSQSQVNDSVSTAEPERGMEAEGGTERG